MTQIEGKIRFHCGTCGKRLKADRKKAGRSARCTKCNSPVPVPRKDLGRMQIRLYCPECGARIRAFVDRAGKEVQCTRCKETIQLPKIGKKKETGPPTKPKQQTQSKPKPKAKARRKGSAAPRRKPEKKEGKRRPSAYVLPVPEEKAPPPAEAAAPRSRPLLKIALVLAGILLLVAAGVLIALRVTSPEWLNVRLMRAARDGDMHTVRSFLLWGADVNSKTPIPQTPLHWAAMEGHGNIAELLLDHGADINATDENGKTPLFQTVDFGHWGITQLLICRGADANIADNSGFTPLYWAAHAGNKDVVELLVAAGADINATVAVTDRAANGKSEAVNLTALDAAIMAGHKGVAAFLRKQGAISRMGKR